MNGWMYGWMNEWMDGWMDEWMVGWMDGWMNGWMDGWMDEQPQVFGPLGSLFTLLPPGSLALFLLFYFSALQISLLPFLSP